MSDRPFGLEDADFWTDPWKTRGDLMFKLVGGRRTALLLDGPGEVSIANHADLPLLLLWSRTKREDLAAPFDLHALLVGVGLSDRRVYVNQVEKEPWPRVGAKAPPSDEQFGDSFRFDARERLGFPWKPGEHVFTVILRDRVSNRVRTRLKRSELEYDDPAVREFVERARRAPAPIAAAAPPVGDPYPCYRRLDASPEVPEEPGLALAVERVILVTGGARAVVHGSFRLPVRPGDLVPPPPPDPPAGEDAAAPAADVPRPAAASGASGAAPAPAAASAALGGTTGMAAPAPLDAGPRPTAILPVTLLATGTSAVGPYRVDLRVPVYGELEGSADEPVATGHFAIDLFAHTRLDREAQTYFLYGLHGEHMTPPVPMALVTEDMLE